MFQVLIENPPKRKEAVLFRSAIANVIVMTLQICLNINETFPEKLAAVACHSLKGQKIFG